MAWLRTERGRLALLLALFVAAAVAYNVTTPLYEAPDEHAHFQVALWLKETGTLPRIPDDLARVSHEIGQPPLYYALVALVILPFDTADAAAVAPFNPHWAAGGGRMVHYHDAREAWPWRGTTLAVHAARLLSTLLGLLTIVATYRIARLLLPEAPLLPAALLAFNPQFAFMSGTITNDSLVTTAATLTLWLVVAILVERRRAPGWYLLLGALWGGAALAKLGGLALGGIIALLFLALWRRPAGLDWRALLPRGLLAGAGFLIVAGWWFGRNWLLYGDPLAWEALLLVNRQLLLPEQLSIWEALVASTFMLRSYWLLFAYGLLGPSLFYVGINLLLLLALGGLLWAVAGRRLRGWTGPQKTGLALLAVWALLFYALLLRWIRLTEASNHGRLLLPAGGAIALLLALGLITLHRRLPRLAVTYLAAWTLLGPLLVIRPAFATPPALAADAPIPTPLSVTVDDRLALLGVDLPADRWLPGEEPAFTLYWQGVTPMETSYVLAPRLLDSSGRVVAAADTIPAAGRFPTPMWTPGARFAATQRLPPIAAGAAPGLARLVLYVYPFGAPETFPPLTVGAQPAGWPILLATGKIGDPDPPDPPPDPPAATFGSLGRLWLTQPPEQTGAGLALTLTWQAAQPAGADYQVFVHLLDAQGSLVAQADGPPAAGAWPTAIWEPGDLIRDPRRFTLADPAGLPPGSYRVLVGLYRLADGTRLPALAPDGGRYPDDAVPLAAFTVP